MFRDPRPEALPAGGLHRWIHRVGTGGALGVHYFRDPDAVGGYGSTRQYFAESTAAGVGDLVARVKGTLMREGSRADRLSPLLGMEWAF